MPEDQASKHTGKGEAHGFVFPRSREDALELTEEIAEAQRAAITTAGISERLASMFENFSDEEIVKSLAEVGYSTSYETVRRYRKGLSSRIDAAFLAAVVIRWDLDANYVLVGTDWTTSPELEKAQDAQEVLDMLWEAAPQALRRLIVYASAKAALMKAGEDPEEMDRTFLAHAMQNALKPFPSELEEVWAFHDEAVPGAPMTPEEREEASAHFYGLIDQVAEAVGRMVRAEREAAPPEEAPGGQEGGVKREFPAH